jgi:hypothetical protein
MLFGRKRAIDRLIFEAAEHKREEDYQALFRAIKGRTFYCPVDPASAASIPKGAAYVTQAHDSLRIPLLASINGLKLVPLFTSESDERLSAGRFAIEGLEALSMALKAEGTDGVLFQNNRGSWVGVDKERIRQVLARNGR